MRFSKEVTTDTRKIRFTGESVSGRCALTMSFDSRGLYATFTDVYDRQQLVDLARELLEFAEGAQQ